LQQLLKDNSAELAFRSQGFIAQSFSLIVSPLLCCVTFFLQPLLKDKLSELAAKYGGSKLVLHASEDEDGGSSDMDMDFGGDDDDDDKKRKGPKPAAKAAAAAKGKTGGWMLSMTACLLFLWLILMKCEMQHAAEDYQTAGSLLLWRLLAAAKWA
jgi:hypothetical protein